MRINQRSTRRRQRNKGKKQTISRGERGRGREDSVPTCVEKAKVAVFSGPTIASRTTLHAIRNHHGETKHHIHRQVRKRWRYIYVTQAHLDLRRQPRLHLGLLGFFHRRVSLVSASSARACSVSDPPSPSLALRLQSAHPPKRTNTTKNVMSIFVGTGNNRVSRGFGGSGRFSEEAKQKQRLWKRFWGGSWRNKIDTTDTTVHWCWRRRAEPPARACSGRCFHLSHGDSVLLHLSLERGLGPLLRFLELPHLMVPSDGSRVG